jgi:hydrogenase maturation protease
VTGRILIAGLGNVLMSDDAIGPYCVEYLQANYEFDDRVEVADLGSPGLDLTLQITASDHVIAVDSLRGVEPGSLHVFDQSTLLSRRHDTRLDTHAPALEESILIARLSGDRPYDVKLVGLGGVNFDHGTALSQLTLQRMPALAELVLAQLTELGASWRPRLAPMTPDVWWDTSADAGQLLA